MSDADAASVRLRRGEAGAEPAPVHNEWLTVFGSRAEILIVVLALWEFSSGRLIKPFWISSPSEIWHQLSDWIATGQLWLHVQVTLTETILGFVFGAVSGVLVGL